MKKRKVPTLTESLIPILFMVLSLAFGVGFLKLRTEPIIIMSAFIAAIIALKLGYTWIEMQEAIIEKIAKALPATLILWSVGLLIGSWMFSGTVPMLIYYGVQFINPQFLLVTAFIITAIIAMFTGTSWGAAGTVGVALMGIANGLGVSAPATAGAIVSGAFFGDKLSPLSDTTNLAPIAAGSELYEHIKHMLWTTLPAALLSLIIYYFIGLNSSGTINSSESISAMLNQLDTMFKFNPILFLPVLLIVIGSIKKWPTIPTMLGVSLFSIFLGIIVQGFTLKHGFMSLISGFNINMTTFNGESLPQINTLINRGGVSSVTSTTVLIFCAMGFAGIISKAGMLEIVLNSILKKVNGTLGIILSTIASCFTVAFITGSSYLSILIPGELFKQAYMKQGLQAKNLSRTLADSGTVIVPLIPWSAAGAYMASTLGVPTIEYLPWAILNYSGIIFAVIFAITGIGISKESIIEKNLQYELEREKENTINSEV